MSNESKRLTRIDTSSTRQDTSSTRQDTSPTGRSALELAHTRFRPLSSPDRSSSGYSSSDGSTLKDLTPKREKDTDFTETELERALKISENKTELRALRNGVQRELGILQGVHDMLVDDVQDITSHVRSTEGYMSRSIHLDKEGNEISEESRQRHIRRHTGKYESNVGEINKTIQNYNRRLKDLGSSISDLNRKASEHNREAEEADLLADHQVAKFTRNLPAPFMDFLPTSIEQALRDDVHNTFIAVHNITEMHINIEQ